MSRSLAEQLEALRLAPESAAKLVAPTLPDRASQQLKLSRFCRNKRIWVENLQRNPNFNSCTCMAFSVGWNVDHLSP